MLEHYELFSVRFLDHDNHKQLFKIENWKMLPSYQNIFGHAWAVKRMKNQFVMFQHREKDRKSVNYA